MKNSLIKSNDFPLRQSLFWMDGNEVSSTWGFLARNINDSWRWRCINWLTKNNINTMIFLTYARFTQNYGDVDVNPFKGDFASDIDYSEIAKWDYWLKLGKNAGSNLIPCLYCDGETVTSNREDSAHQYYLDLAIPYLAQYCRALILGLEMTEVFKINKIEQMIAYAKEVRKRNNIPPEKFPISVHLSWKKGDYVIKGQEWGCLEHSWDPHKGNEHSPEEVSQGITDYAEASGLLIGAAEYNLSLDEHQKQQTIAASKNPHCIMVSGPL
jgi:hypothetical protein